MAEDRTHQYITVTVGADGKRLVQLPLPELALVSPAFLAVERTVVEVTFSFDNVSALYRLVEVTPTNNLILELQGSTQKVQEGP